MLVSISLAILIFLYHSSHLNICKLKKLMNENENILDPDQAPQNDENLFGGASMFIFVLKELLVNEFLNHIQLWA